MNTQTIDKDISYVSTLLGQGRLRDAKVHLGLVTQSLIVSQGSLGPKYRKKITQAINEIRSLEEVDRMQKASPQSFSQWLQNARVESQKEGKDLLFKIQALVD